MDTERSGNTPVPIALENGWPKLAVLIQQWSDFNKFMMLRRMHGFAKPKGR